MTSVSGVNAATATATATSGTDAKSGTLIDSDFQTFLVMLTTQMKNQDPLNPIESTEYAQQLATFSGVEQQVRTNTLLTQLASQFGVSGMAEFASWVGMQARVEAPVAFSGSPVTLYPEPMAGADKVLLVATDASGTEVMRSQLTSGSDPVTWAGTDASGSPLASGNYSFQLENYSGDQLIGASAVSSFATVSEVRQTAGGSALILDSGASVAPSEVKALRGAGG